MSASDWGMGWPDGNAEFREGVPGGKKWRTQQRRLQRELCAYCETSLHGQRGSIEHVIPRSWGGPVGAPFNKLLVCMPCQREKSRWESITHRIYYHHTGILRARELVKSVRQEATDKRALRFGPRVAIFRNIPLHVERASQDPGWAQVTPERRAIFFGPRHQYPLMVLTQEI